MTMMEMTFKMVMMMMISVIVTGDVFALVGTAVQLSNPCHGWLILVLVLILVLIRSVMIHIDQLFSKCFLLLKTSDSVINLR